MEHPFNAVLILLYFLMVFIQLFGLSLSASLPFDLTCFHSNGELFKGTPE